MRPSRIIIRLTFFFCLIHLQSIGQEFSRDTIERDIGLNVSWRSLIINYPSVVSGADVARNLVFGVEVRAWKFWIHSGLILGWSNSKTISEEFNIDVFLAPSYEIPLIHNRLRLGVGPILGYYYHVYQIEGAELANTRNISKHSLSLGVNLELTVPLYKGLQFETSSDFGLSCLINNGGNAPFSYKSLRLVSVGFNYRFKAYEK